MRVRPAPKRAGGDLHVHTTHSDGVCSPGEVVRTAFERGLRALAITDHDTVSAISVGRSEADRLGIELISGIEVTAERDGREVHILGHYVDENSPDLKSTCESMRIRRAGRIESMVDRLTAAGIKVDLTALRNAYPRATIGRRHLADWLVRTGQFASQREVFATQLGNGGPADVPKPRIPCQEAIDLIRAAGGIAGLAHPPFDLREATLEDYVKAGMGSIEVAGPGINPKLGLRWRGWAEQFGLIPIAGTDFHANDRPGRWLGRITTPDAELDRLRALASQSNARQAAAVLTSG